MKIIVILVVASFCRGKQHVCNVYFDKQHDGMFADCKGRQLRHFANDLPYNITALDISENKLESLINGTFNNFPNLTYVNLNANLLTNLESGVFKGLYNLNTLLLARNKLKHAFPKGIFSDLGNLQTLNLEQNEMRSYPDWAFPPLTKLHSLYMDSVPVPVFGPGFSSLANLRVLQMDSTFLYGGDCSINKLTNQTFQGLKGIELEVLILNYCYGLNDCEKGVLEPLMFLKHLEMSSNRIGLQNSLQLLHPLVGRNMSRIWFNRTVSPHSHYKQDIDDRILTAKSTEYLTEICVEELSLRYNQIILVESGSINKQPLRDCIEVLDMSKNNIVGDGSIFLMFPIFQRLRYLDISYQRQEYALPESQLLSRPNNVTISFPHNFTYFDATLIANAHFSTPVITLLNTTNLETFRIGYNNLNGLNHIRGLENVKNIYLSGSEFGTVTDSFFNSFLNARKLSLGNCNLQFVKRSGNSSSNILNGLRAVENLDLSSNNLRYFPVLPNAGKIVHVNLSHNSIDTVSIGENTYKSLALLDMSFNLIGQLSKETRSQLDIASIRTSLKLKVEGNIFSCGCENLDFILWLMDTSAIYESDRDFPCIQDNGTMTGTIEVAKNQLNIHRHCTGKLLLSLTVTCMIVVLTSIFIAYVISKNPTRYRNIVIRMFGFGVEYVTPKQFEFTFYVGYCGNDVPFVYRILRPGLELCIRPVRLFLKDREVLPGKDIAEGIIEGVNGSWKTILVISPDFLKDSWTHFTITSAVYAMSDVIPNRIIVLLVGDVLVKDLPECLLNMVEEDCILRVKDYMEEEVEEDETLCGLLRNVAGL